MFQESFQEKVRVELDLLSPITVGAKEKTPGTELDINKEEGKNWTNMQNWFVSRVAKNKGRNGTTCAES